MNRPIPYVISERILAKAVARILKEESFGLADCQVEEIRGVCPTGESFPVEKLELKLVRKNQASSQPQTVQIGKLRLAAVEGVVL